MTGFAAGNFGITFLGLPLASDDCAKANLDGFLATFSTAIKQISQSQFCNSPPLDLVILGGKCNFDD